MDDAFGRIRALKSLILSQQLEGDRLRRLPDVVAKAFVDADLYRLQIPVDLGGAGLDPLTFFDVVKEVSSWDGSTGWNLAIGAGAGLLCGGLSRDKLTSIFETADCGFAGSSAPGQAKPVEGGFLLSGRYAWASAIHQARWVMGTAVLHDGQAPMLTASGAPTVRFFLIPRDNVSILDTWNSGGMRGTGSTDWEVRDLFVPIDDTFVAGSGVSEHPSPIFRLPGTFSGFSLTAVALGIAWGAIEGLKQLSVEFGSALNCMGYVHYDVAKAEALHDAGNAYARSSFQIIWENVLEGRIHTIEQRARARRAYVHAVESAVEATGLCHRTAGGAAAFEKWPFSRALRDVNTIAAHHVLSRRFMELAGQASLGLPVTNPQF